MAIALVVVAGLLEATERSSDVARHRRLFSDDEFLAHAARKAAEDTRKDFGWKASSSARARVERRTNPRPAAGWWVSAGSTTPSARRASAARGSAPRPRRRARARSRVRASPH